MLRSHRIRFAPLALFLIAAVAAAGVCACDDGAARTDADSALDTTQRDQEDANDAGMVDVTSDTDRIDIGSSDTAGATDQGDADDGYSRVEAELAEYAPYYEPERVLQIEIELPPASWDALRMQTRTLLDILGPGCLDAPPESPFTWFRAHVTIDGERVEDVGVRKKGLLGSLSETRPSLKVKFDRYVDDQHFHTMERMTLNNGRQDPSLVQQCLGYGIFTAAGRPAPRCNFATVSVNGESLGVYVHVQDIKKQFLREHFVDDEGALYEGTLSDFRDGWRATFERKTNEEVVDRSDLLAVAKALEADDATLLDELDAVIDLDGFFTHWALEVLVGHWDGYVGNNNNFMIYADPAAEGLQNDQTGQSDAPPRFEFIPWGVDALFTPWTEREYPAESVVAVGGLAHRLMSHPEGRARYEARLRELLDTVWDEDVLIAELDRMHALVREHAAPERQADIDQRVGRIRDYILSRRAEITSELDAGISWEQPLREPICLQQSGTVDWSFDTTWGTHPEPDIFATGTATNHEFTLDGQSPALTPMGSKAGLDMDGRAVFTLAGVLSPQEVIVVFIAMDPERLRTGELVLEGTPGEVVVGRFLPQTEMFELIGYVLEGSLTFEAVGTTQDDPVSGRITGVIFEF